MEVEGKTEARMKLEHPPDNLLTNEASCLKHSSRGRWIPSKKPEENKENRRRRNEREDETKGKGGSKTERGEGGQPPSKKSATGCQRLRQKGICCFREFLGFRLSSV
ncbi:hypothetical protein V6N13_049305 [Hibiscus sabdariffa]